MRRSRFAGAKKTREKSKYKSGFEEKIAKNLERIGALVAYEVDKYKYTVPESKHTYTPDFKLKEGVYCEGKGRLTTIDRRKMVLFKAQNPGVMVYILFQRDNVINAGSKTRYSDWARKNGFEYHVSSKGEIPKEWLV